LKQVLEELSSNTNPTKDETRTDTLAFMFVSPVHTNAFDILVETIHQHFEHLKQQQQQQQGAPASITSKTTIVALIGGGVIGNGNEYDDPQQPSLSILVGQLPYGAQIQFRSWKKNQEKVNPDEYFLFPSPPPSEHNRQPSYLIFGDPWSSVETLMNELSSSSSSTTTNPSIMAGGISCPSFVVTNPRPPSSLAINGQVLEAGSALVLRLSGTITLQTLVAQGCKPITKTPYTITAGEGNIIESLNGQPALQVLKELTANCSPEDAQLIRQELLCGIAIPSSNSENTKDKDSDAAGTSTARSCDYLCRQIVGFVPAIQGIAIAGKIKEGDSFVFQVRDKKSAAKDMKLMVQRAKAARLFYQQEEGSVSSTFAAGGDGEQQHQQARLQPLAALQISCVARGRGLFQIPNADVTQIQELFDTQQCYQNDNKNGDEDDSSRRWQRSIPIGGFFANGEIGPVGLAGFSPPSYQKAIGISDIKKNNYIHGFTTVAAILCETNVATTATGEATNVVKQAPTAFDQSDTWG
jgi:small ligand-binding sensory domain FIST